MKRSDLSDFIRKHNAEVKNYSLPLEITQSDNELTKNGRKRWIERRNTKYEMIRNLVSTDTLERYLFGDGIAEDIKNEMPRFTFKSKGYYYNILNRFLTFGCIPNALLPFKLKNVGRTYLHSTNANIVKRGRCGKNNEHSRSKTQGITTEIKRQITRVVSYAKKQSYKKFPITKLFMVYQDNFEMIEISKDGEPTVRLIKPECERISYEQFYYHFKRLISNEQYLRLCLGDTTYEKDIAPRAGVARDGVIGPSYRYEIDSTVLDLYVRYPYDLTERYTMGRPILYIVVDVYSTCIAGFYIGFSGPNWAGASEALVNACTDKVAYCAELGINITESDWPCCHIPFEIAMDNGTDYPVGANTNLIASMIGIQTAIYLAVFRGDAKGVCERKFGVANDDFIHFEAGSIFKETRREDSHPSNHALWDLDALKRALIHEFIYHNKTSERLRLHNFALSQHQVGITPNAIYIAAMDREMNGGKKSTNEDMLNVRWALLEEMEATVTEKGVRFEGLFYDSDYIRENGWLHKAAFNGNFKIFVRRTRASTNRIWHRTDNNEIITLDIKHEDSAAFTNQHWDCVLHRLEQYKNEAHELANQQLAERAKKDAILNTERAIQQQLADQAPKNSRKSAQPNIKDKADIEKAIASLQLSKTINDSITSNKATQKLETNIAYDDFDINDELYNS